MPETWPDHAPSPRTMLVWDGTRYRPPRTHTDGTVQVRGEDQLHSFGSPLGSDRTAVVSGADGYVASHPCSAGEVWHVTNVLSYLVDRATTASWLNATLNAVNYPFHYEAAAKGAAEPWVWRGDAWLEEDDVILATFIGCLAGDNAKVVLVGESFTKET